MTTEMAMEGSDVGEDSNSMNIDVGENSRDYDSCKSNDNDNDDRNGTDCDMEVSDDTQDCERLSPADLNSDRTTSPHRRSPVDNPNDLDTRNDASPRHHASPMNHVNGSLRNDAESPANHDDMKSPHHSSHGSPKSQNGIESPRDFVDASSPGRHYSRSPGLNGHPGSPYRHGSAGSPDHYSNAASPDNHSSAGSLERSNAGSPHRPGSAGSPDHHGNAGSPDRHSITGSLERNGNAGSPDAGSPGRHGNHGSPRHDGGTTSSSGRKRHNSDIPQQHDHPASPGLYNTRRSPERYEKERSSNYHYACTGSPSRHTSMVNPDLNDRRGTSKEFRIRKSPGHHRTTRSPDHNTTAARTVYPSGIDRKYYYGKIESSGNRESAGSPGQRSHTDSPAIPKTGSPGFHGNADHHSEDSTSCSPCEERVGNTSPQLPAVLPPVRITNFSIAEILKPNFGLRRCNNLRAYPPVLSGSRNASVQRNYSLDLRDKQRFSLPRETRPDYSARGVKQLPNFGVPHPFFSRQSEGRELQRFSRELSGGPLDMTRLGQEALERNRKSLAESRVVPPGTPRPECDPQPRSSSSSLSPPEPGSQPPQSPREGTSGQQLMWPAWVYCTRYSDRPSAGPRTRKRPKRRERPEEEEKRPRTAFSSQQLQRLRQEFETCRYLTEQRRQDLARELQLTESQIKIWFQNKRAKIKKASGAKNPLALSLMAQGLYNHATVPREPGDPSTTTTNINVNINIDT